MHFSALFLSTYLFSSLFTNALPVLDNEQTLRDRELPVRRPAPVRPAVVNKPVQRVAVAGPAPARQAIVQRPVAAPKVPGQGARIAGAPPARLIGAPPARQAAANRPVAAPKVPGQQAAVAGAPPANLVGAPPVRQPTSKTPGPVPAGAVGNACPLPKTRTGRNRKRVITLTNAPNKMTITIGGKEFALTKNCAQGLTGICYVLDDGTGFAKANPNGQSVAAEAENTRIVGLLLATGVDTGKCAGDASGSEWLIVKKVPGSILSQHRGFSTFKRSVTSEQCREKAEVLANLAFAKAESIAATAGLLHKDIHPANVIFAEDIDVTQVTTANVGQFLSKVNLVDWSSVSKTQKTISAIQRRGLAASFKAC